MDPTLRDVLFPARDPTFGGVVRTLSEPETGPHADNLVTNEDSFPRVCGELARRAPADSVYLGVGPDQNLTYIAHARPKVAFVMDYRRRNLRLHLLHKALMALSADRAAYLGRLTARRPDSIGETTDDLVRAFESAPFDRTRLDEVTREVRATLEPLGVLEAGEWADLETIAAKLAGPGMGAKFLALPMYPTFGRLIRTPDRDGRPAHVLTSEEWYRRVRDLHRGDRILPIVGDLAGETALPRLGDWLRRHRLKLGVIYLSDVEFFLLRGGHFAAFADRLAALPWAEGAVLIRTSTRPLEGHAERMPGDSATTILRDVAPFLEAARAERIREHDDLFAPA